VFYGYCVIVMLQVAQETKADGLPPPAPVVWNLGN